jgi:FkbM family methyltransferase
MQSIRDFLKRSERLVALVKAVRWKTHLLKDWWGTRIWTRTSEVMTPLGFKLTSGFHPAYALMRTGQFEVQETAIISKVLRCTDLFVDIGANLGYYTCLARKLGKQVIAFEPQHQNLQCLFQNLIANGWQDDTEIFPLALSDKPGLLTLYGASGPSASLVKDWAGYSSRYQKIVPVSTLDNILKGRLLGKRLLIKMDVEGAEATVLAGASETLARQIKPIWLLEVSLNEFYPNGTNPAFLTIFELFWSHGYKSYTATQPPKPVVADDVKRWVRNNRSDSDTFNYLFASESDFLALERNGW